MLVQLEKSKYFKINRSTNENKHFISLLKSSTISKTHAEIKPEHTTLKFIYGPIIYIYIYLYICCDADKRKTWGIQKG